MKDIIRKPILVLYCLLCLALTGQAQSIIFSENFDGLPNGTISTAFWDTDVTDCIISSGDYFETRAEIFQCSDIDGEGIWFTQPIDISAYQDISLEVQLTEEGSMESSDYVRVMYRLNGGPETPFAVNSYLNNDFTSATALQTGLNGSTVSVIIKMKNNAGGEIHQIQSVLVRGTATAAAPLSITDSILGVTCAGGSNGAITVSAAGGTPPYTYQWRTGQTTETIGNLMAGWYYLTVYDATGTDSVQTFYEVQQGAALQASLIQKTASPDAVDGVIYSTITGGQPPYSYQWSNGSNTAFNFEVEVGTYFVSVTDYNGCTATAYTSVDTDTLYSVTYEDFERPSPDWLFMGNTTANTWVVSNNTCAYHSYSLQVNDGSGCSYNPTAAADIWAYRAIDAANYTDLSLRFDWIGYGEPGYDYGAVWLSLDAVNWQRIPHGGATNEGWYEGTSIWRNQHLPLPDSLNNQVFYLGFQWINDGSIGGSPSFVVDNVHIQGLPGAPMDDGPPPPPAVVACPAAGECIWMGMVSNRWDNRYNWDCDRIPNETDRVIVVPNRPHNLLMDTVGICSVFKVEGTDPAAYTTTSNAMLNVHDSLIVQPLINLQGGTIRLAGELQQTISTAVGAKLYNLQVDNASAQGVVLTSSELQLNGKLILLDGILHTNGRLVHLLNTSAMPDSVRVQYNDSSYVAGRIKQAIPQGMSQLTYPIGTSNNSLFAAVLTFDSLPGLSHIEASFEDKITPADTSVNIHEEGKNFTALHETGYWKFTPDTTPTNIRYTVQLLISGMDSLQDNQYIVALKDTSSNQWKSNNGEIPPAGSPGRVASTGWAKRYNLSKLTDMGIAIAPIVTGGPANMNIHGNYDGYRDIAELQLSTGGGGKQVGDGTEIAYTVERSYDGGKFEAIPAHIIVTGDGDVQITDNNPQKGTTFYRLAYKTADGEPAYTDMVAITKTYSKSNFIVFPNPGDGLFNVNFGLEEPDFQLIVADMNGNIVYNFSGTVNGQTLEQAVDLRGRISAGYYLVRLMTPTETYVRKISVVH